MYVYRLISITLFLLIATVCRSQQQNAADSSGIYSRDTTSEPPPVERYDVAGKKISLDSTVAFGSDSIVPSKDTTGVLTKKHSPAKAVLFSAALPGLGQAYNKKYWKMPIIYAGFGGLGYWLYFESHEFNLARTAYRSAVRNTSTYSAIYQGQELDAATIKTYRDYYKNFLNYAALATVLWYGLNLIDAAVDGHLYHYNMDEKLSFNFDPSFLLPNNLGMSQTCLGLTFTIVPLGGKKVPKMFEYQQ